MLLYLLFLAFIQFVTVLFWDCGVRRIEGNQLADSFDWHKTLSFEYKMPVNVRLLLNSSQCDIYFGYKIPVKERSLFWLWCSKLVQVFASFATPLSKLKAEGSTYSPNFVSFCQIKECLKIKRKQRRGQNYFEQLPTSSFIVERKVNPAQPSSHPMKRMHT